MAARQRAACTLGRQPARRLWFWCVPSFLAYLRMHDAHRPNPCLRYAASLHADPLGLGGDPDRLAWFAESERVHSRWAMLAVAGILVQVHKFFVTN